MPSFIASTNVGAQILASGEFGVITATGSVVTAGSAAITFAGAATPVDISVAGMVRGVDGIRGSGGVQITVGETGMVTGRSAAIRATEGSALTAVGLSNAGMVSGNDGAILTGATVAVVNSGTLSGLGGVGLSVGSAGSLFVSNSGEMSGRLVGLSTNTLGLQTIVNTGHITGQSAGMSLGDGHARVTNHGVIEGGVLLGAGSDRYDGAHGVQSIILGGEGRDTLIGGQSGETLMGGIGNDVLRGNAGDDSLLGESNDDVMSGGDGDDTLTGDRGNDVLSGGAGDDTLDGGLHTDVLNGGLGDDLLLGGDNADRLMGGAGADTLKGDTGADVLMGGQGDDVLAGGSGADVFVFARGQGADVITDFEKGIDLIDLQLFGLASAEQVKERAMTAGDTLLIDLSDLGGGTLLLQGHTLASFSFDDVLV